MPYFPMATEEPRLAFCESIVFRLRAEMRGLPADSVRAQSFDLLKLFGRNEPPRNSFARLVE